MKILLICKGEYRYFFPAIARALRNLADCEVSAVTFTGPATRMVERIKSFNEVHNLAAYLKESVRRCNLQESTAVLREFEHAGDCATLNTMVHADRIISRYPYQGIISILAAVIRFWEQLLSDMRPDAIVGEVACATEWLCWTEAQRLNIPYLIPCPTPVANRFFFIGAPAGSWLSMQRSYEEAKERSLSPEEAHTAELFVQEFRARKSKPPFLAWGQRSPFLPDIRQIGRRAARIPFRIQSYIEDGEFEVGSYHGTPPWNPIWQDTLKVIRHAFCESAVCEHSVPEGPSVYFPLHVQPEFTTDVRAPFLSNQVAVIENISKSIPIGHRFIVKEHPNMKGERRLSFYRQLKKLHNVQLVSPSIDSHTLIERSDAVLTITGSSAWEAILYEKPVIAFGPLCYGFYDLIFHCREFSEFPKVISVALNQFRPKHELLLKFVWSFLQSAYEVEWGDPIRIPRILEKQNIEKVASAILAETASRTSLAVPEFVSN
ncbi:MAG TPA: hypothetical protein VGT03_05620 [Candidatus Acidoferrales bacterium]|nr:hypothetical protein [Candidatus Acidoferrales bacterium]